MKHNPSFADSTRLPARGNLRLMPRLLYIPVGLCVGALVPCACSDDLVPPTPMYPPEAESSEVGAPSTVSGAVSSAPSAATEATSPASEPEPEAEPEPEPAPPPSATPTSPEVFELENMEITGDYAESISMPFSGVGLYANGDAVSVEHTFPELPGTYRVDVTGASSNNFVATAELRLGTRNLGQLSFRGTTTTTQSVEFSVVSETPATRTLRLVAVNDNDTWDLFVDRMELIFVRAGE